jgi:glycosyltransferase involved in cell wall biosynthesis
VIVIFTHLPPKPGHSSGIYTGRHSVTSGFIDALTKRTPSIRIIVYTPKSRYKKYCKFKGGYQFPDRIELLDVSDLQQSIDPDDPVVIQTLETSLRDGLHLRYLCGFRPWPVIGMTHDLSSVEVCTNLLLSLVGKPSPYDAIICSSKCAQGVLERLVDITSSALNHKPQFQLPIIPLGIDLDALNELRAEKQEDGKRFINSEPILLCLGRLSYTMKADLLPLIRAFKRVRRKVCCHLIIAGGVISPDEESVIRIERMVSELNMDDHITVFTDISEQQKWELMSTADIFVSMPDSLQESFGLVLLEAMAMGLPIVASDWNGYREVVDNGVSGILIDTMMPKEGLDGISKRVIFEDRWWWYGEFGQTVILNLRQLEAAMLSLLENPDLRLRMGRAGCDRVQRLFSWDHVIALHENEWRRLVMLAKRLPPNDSDPGYWYSHSEVFSGHPSGFFDFNSRVRVSPNSRGEEFEMRHPPPFLSRKCLQFIMTSVQIETRIGDLSLPKEEALCYISYLLKHGLIELVNESYR